MDIPGVRFKQGSRPFTFVAGAAIARDLIAAADVDRKSSERPDGYQRELRRQRLAEIARYLTDEEGIFPGSIICAIRGSRGWRFDSAGSTGGVEQGVLRVDDGTTLWVIDGQNRLYGLQRAIEEAEDSATKDELELMTLPVTVVTDVKKFDEMRIFFVVNDRQKAVPTDLVDHLLLESLTGGKVQTAKERSRALATDVATQLARAEGGPWYRRISLPDEAPLKTYQLKLHPFVASIQEHFNPGGALVEYVEGDDVSRAVHVVGNYWDAIRRLLPDAFAEPGDFSLQRTPGVYSLHMLLPDVLKLCEQDSDATVKKMATILDNVELLKLADSWSNKEKEKANPLTLGTNMRLIRMLRDEMRMDLPRPRIAL